MLYAIKSNGLGSQLKSAKIKLSVEEQFPYT